MTIFKKIFLKLKIKTLFNKHLNFQENMDKLSVEDVKYIFNDKYLIKSLFHEFIIAQNITWSKRYIIIFNDYIDLLFELKKIINIKINYESIKNYFTLSNLKILHDNIKNNNLKEEIEKLFITLNSRINFTNADLEQFHFIHMSIISFFNTKHFNKNSKVEKLDKIFLVKNIKDF